MKTKLLEAQDLIPLQKELPKWEVQQSKLRRKWRFKNFVEAFGFMTKVALSRWVKDWAWLAQRKAD